MKRIQPVIVLLALCCACSPKVETGGFVRDTDIKSQITPGVTTRDEVRARFGSPSAQSSFGDETWYYITDRKETVAFLKPEVVEQDVVRIEFDSLGVVSSVQAFDENAARDFKLVKRETPTEGHTMGFFEQILGNIGRFNRPAGDSGAAPGRRPDGY